MNLSQFQQSLERERQSENTVKKYLTILKRFFKQYREMNQQSIADYIDRKKEPKQKKFSNTYVNLCYAVFRKFARFNGQNELAEKMKNVRVPIKIPDALTKEQLDALFHAALSSSKRKSLNIRNRLIVEFLYSSGVRVSEASKANQSDLSPKDGTGLIRGGKGGDDRIVSISKEWFQQYFEFYGKREEKTPLFLNQYGTRLSARGIEKIVQSISLKSGVFLSGERLVSPHKFRSTNATDMFNSSKNIMAVKYNLGHKSLVPTQRYVRSGAEELKKVKNPLSEYKEEGEKK